MRNLRVKAVSDKVGVHKTTIWGWVRDGKFPAPYNLSSGVTVWDEAEIDAWLEERKAESKQQQGESNEQKTE